MIRKFLSILLTAFTIGVSAISCSEEISDCPNKLCVMAGGWKLQEVQLDGETFNGDYSGYQLILNDPAPATEASSQFQRVNIGGTQETGTWSVENTNQSEQTPFKGSILRLKPSGSDLLKEDWEIESFTPREMVLVLHRDITAKDGPAVIRFVLVPF
jgi:hypothetical protein